MKNFDDIKQMIPDYLSGELSDEEKEIFEKELTTNPSLRKKLEFIRPLFENLDALDYKSHIEKQSRNLPQNLVATLAERKARRNSLRTWRKIAIPVASMLILAIIFIPKMNLNFKGEDKNIAELATDTNTVFIFEDVAVTDDIIEGYAEMEIYNQEENTDNEPILEINVDIIDLATNDNYGDDIVEILSEDDINYDVLSEFENIFFDECMLTDEEMIDDEDIEIILEVMSDVTIL